MNHSELIAKLRKFANTLTANIMTGHDHPNSQDELDRLNSARFLREAADALQAMERVPMTDEQWQEIADITGSIITRRGKDAIEKVLGITPPESK